jgi:hypothetical protein
MDREPSVNHRAPPVAPSAPPTGLRARLAVVRGPAAAMALGQACIGFLVTSLGPCLILLARDLAVPRERLSWLSGGFGAGLLLAGLTGEVLLRRGAWSVLRFAAAAMAAGALLMAFADGIPAVQAGALLLGLGGAFTNLCGPVLLAGPDAAAQLTFAVGVSSASGIVAPLLLSSVEASTGHGRVALLLALPALAWLVAGRRRAPPGRGPAAPPRARLPARSVAAALRAWLAMVAAISPEFFFVVWGASRMLDSGLSPAAAAGAAAAFPAGMAVGRLLVPRLIGRVPLVAGGAVLALAATLLCAAPVGPPLAAAALGLAGLGIAPLYPMLIDQLIRVPGLDLRRGAALGSLASGVSVMGAPILLNALASLVALRLGFLAAVPLLVAVLLLHRRERPDGAGAPGGGRA